MSALLGLLVAGAAASTTQASGAGTDIMQYLNDTVDWYHRVVSLQQTPATSGELLLRETARQDARQVVRLGIEFGRGAASLTEGNGATTGPAGARGRSLAAAAATAGQRVTALQAQVQQLNRAIESGGATAVAVAQRDRAVAQLDLATAQRDTLNGYAAFVSGAESGDMAGLSAKVEQLAKSVPEVMQGADATATGAAATAAASTAASAASAVREEANGVFGLVGEMFTLSERMRDLAGLAKDAGKLADANAKLRGPVRDEVMDAVRQGQRLGATTAPVDDVAALSRQRGQFEDLATRFKRLTAASVPLGEQAAVIDLARQDLLNWRGQLGRQYSAALRSVLIRLAVLAAVVGGLLVGSDLWRRATFKYVADVRRRRQLMLIRRAVVAVLLVIIITLNLVSEFGSLATFAGLITAGIAVALQTIILSGVAYFFFIGRFGVRVGDRVTISGITGDVVEIGVFRIYLMELGGTGDPSPTGRIVVFSNAVLFQPAAFYKQVPGADYVWHEVSFTLATGTDYRLAEDRLVGAIQRVYDGYKDEIHRQHQRVAGRLQVQMDEPRPRTRLRFAADGLEFVVRYPVEVRRAGEIDNKITRSLLEAVNEEPKLTFAASGRPTIRPAG